MLPIKLLIADVDGTLVTKAKVITPRAREAVDRLRSAGIEFTITSGRPPRGMAMLTEALKLKAPIAAFNGGMFVEPDLTTVREELLIPVGVGIQVIDYLLKEGLDAWVYSTTNWYLRRLDAPHAAHEQQTVQFAPTVVEDLHSILNEVVKIVGVSDDAQRIACAEAEMRSRLGSYVSASSSQPYYIDFTNRDANKGMVVRMTANYFGISTSQIAVIGDGLNDVLMFANAGLSIAMGNAAPEVQRMAKYVTGSNEADGFADAVDQIILGGHRSAEEKLGLPPLTRACLFDLDGVLTQTAKLHAAAWKRMFDDFLLQWSSRSGKAFVPFDTVHDYQRYVDGKLRIDGARSFLASRGIQLPEEKILELAAAKDTILLQLLQQGHVETYAGSVRYLHAARNAGLRTAVVSSSKHCEQVLVSAGIADLFDARIDGNVAAANHLGGKPAPDTYLAAAHALGVEPAQAAVFEDALSGVEAGRAGRFGYVVGVDRVGQAKELHRHGADTVVTDLSILLEVAA
jgi:Cof subfamily protein (haloacid dehalogenase superfamily)/beta-phosphoglucomutase family hydrolase